MRGLRRGSPGWWALHIAAIATMLLIGWFARF